MFDGCVYLPAFTVPWIVVRERKLSSAAA